MKQVFALLFLFGKLCAASRQNIFAKNRGIFCGKKRKTAAGYLRLGKDLVGEVSR